MTGQCLALLVPRKHVKSIKTGLELRGQFDRSKPIAAENVEDKETRMIITTLIPLSNFSLIEEEEAQKKGDLQYAKETILSNIGCALLKNEIDISILSTVPASVASTFESKNAVIKALYDSLSLLPKDLFESLDLTPAQLASSFSESYSIYKPMLLLPSHAMGSTSWTKLLGRHPADSSTLAPVWKALTRAVGCTHLAINAGIPLQKEKSSSSTKEENILRSPSSLQPIYGDLGPAPTAQLLALPTAYDFEQASWVSTTQNGIHQVWAPLYTMFSRGNIREKTRLLTHPNVTSCTGSAAVDLYSGIGYFAFSYARAGLRPILCWELNPWSIEGLRRGAALNGWSTRVFTPASLPSPGDEGHWREWAATLATTDFLIFQQSNEYAAAIMHHLTPFPPRNTAKDKRWPAIRHVNLGLLPASSLSWPTAIRIIDPKLGGWLHVHENVGVGDIEQRSGEIEESLQGLLDQLSGEGKGGSKDGDEGNRKVRVEHVERVKTFAPGVVHAVFDCWVDGAKEGEIRK